MCHNLYAHTQTHTHRHTERYFNAIINLHISNCCHGTMLSNLISLSCFITHKRGWLWFLQQECVVHWKCILHFQKFLNWNTLMSNKFLSCSTNLVQLWNSFRSFDVCIKQKKSLLWKFSNLIEIRDNNDHFQWLSMKIAYTPPNIWISVHVNRAIPKKTEKSFNIILPHRKLYRLYNTIHIKVSHYTFVYACILSTRHKLSSRLTVPTFK